ncbi:MAG: ATP-binding cassette domain-containing protein [Bacteroidales bacterium]|nr:ATP-binding cassette domain-containing protein [Bacteroidales bacterium]
MLTIDNLSVSYGTHTVLSQLDLSLERGGIHGIVGFNGAGKTTLLNAIYGIPAQRDCIRFDGMPLSRRDIAYLETESYFYSRITGRDYLKLFQARSGGFDFETLCSVFSLPLDHFVDSYSTGMKKKLALTGILSLDRKVLLLDEPFNGLDLESVSVLQLALRKLRAAGKLVVVTSHILESLSPLCDAIHLLQDGRIYKSYLPVEYPLLADKLRADAVAKYDAALSRVFGE